MKATKQQIEDWKQKHGSVFLIEVEDKAAYIKVPGRKELSAATQMSNGGDPFEFNKVILDTCWLDGDEAIKTEDRLFLGVCAELDQIIEKAEARVKKL